MIFHLMRLFFLAFVGLTVVYLILRWFTASLRREALENEFEENDHSGDRSAFVEAGMKKYRKSFRRKALILVYLIPLGLYLVILYLNNFY